MSLNLMDQAAQRKRIEELLANPVKLADEIESLRQQLAAANEEIERLKQCHLEQMAAVQIRLAENKEQLAASQSYAEQLREAVEDARTADDLNYCASGAYFTDVIDKALALPQDTTALEAMIAKAGEVTRERCAVFIET